MPVNGRKPVTLDGREVMELWVRMDTLKRVYNFFKTQGRVNPDTGQFYSISALNRSAWLFMVKHPEEARELHRQAGAVYTDEEWELMVLRRATQLWKTGRSTFLRWVIQQEWPRKYEYLYRDDFDVQPEDYDFYRQTTRRMGESAKPDGDSEDLPE